jgi:hypothetical protein
MPVIPVHKLADKKRIIGKMGRGGGEALGVADPKKLIGDILAYYLFYIHH